MTNKRLVKTVVTGLLSFFLVCAFIPRAYAGGKSAQVQINFRNEDILTVLEFYSDLLQKAFIPSGDVQGEVTVISPQPISKSEAKELLFSILDMRQLAVIEYASYFKVITKQNAAKSPLDPAGKNAGADRMISGVIHLKYAKAEDIAPDISRLVSEEGSVLAAKELNYVVVTATAANFDKIERIITQIDKPDSVPVARAYKIQYMKAEAFAETLTRVAESSISKEIVWGGVTPVKETNSIITTATPAQHKQLEALISQLDIPKKQVSISAMFVEVNLTDTQKMGLEWLLQGSSNGVVTNVANQVSSLFNTSDTMTNTVQKILGNGLKLSILKENQFEVLAKALSTNENSRVLSSPHILAMENQEAKLRIGNQVPIRKGTRYDDSGREIITYEQLDLGLELDVTPVISNTGEVTMNIQQKLSDLTNYSSEDGTYQSSERETSTTVAVHDQETLVIGGLITRQDALTQNGIPGLKDIPVLGYLFGTSEDEKKVRELLIFITPTIISNAYDAKALNVQEKAKHSVVVDQTSMEFDL